MYEFLPVSDVLCLLRHGRSSSLQLQTVQRYLSGDDGAAGIVEIELPRLSLFARRLTQQGRLLPLAIRKAEGPERVVDRGGHDRLACLVEFDVDWAEGEGVLDEVLWFV